MAYQEKIKVIPGKGTKDVILYSLSTCFWCEKAIELFNDQGIGYKHLVVDLLPPNEQPEALAEISKYNPDGSFPTIVINNGEKVIIGFNEDDIKALAS